MSIIVFEYGEMDVIAQNDTLNVWLDIKNKSRLNGKEVVQVYVSMPSSNIDRANQELKAFIKTETLKPGETTRIYNINVGASSRDIRQTKSVAL